MGVISVIQDSGLVVSVLAYDQGPRRDFEGLKITVIVFTSLYMFFIRAFVR